MDSLRDASISRRPQSGCGCVKTSNPSARAMAASVMPAASAIRTASAVGAETATISGAPMAAVFCTISTETRLVSSTMPSLAETALLRQRAGELVQRIVAADILAQRDDAARRRPERRGMHRAGFDIDRLQRRDALPSRP